MIQEIKVYGQKIAVKADTQEDAIETLAIELFYNINSLN